MRLHLFEFEDLSWFPNMIRASMVDYLKFLFGNLNFYKPITPLIVQGLDKSGQNKILDLCSGGGGGIVQVQKNLKELTNNHFKITLSDKFPNIAAFRHIEEVTQGKIDFIERPLDAKNVSKGTERLLTMFSAIHHFQPSQVKEIINNAINNKNPIAIFDGGDKNLLPILAILLIHPIILFTCTPFFKPFKISRLLFTYIIPLIPIFTIWDGLVSILRLYNPNDLKRLVKEIDSTTYHWEIGKAKHKLGFRILYLLGYPKV